VAQALVVDHTDENVGVHHGAAHAAVQRLRAVVRVALLRQLVHDGAYRHGRSCYHKQTELKGVMVKAGRRSNMKIEEFPLYNCVVFRSFIMQLHVLF